MAYKKPLRHCHCPVCGERVGVKLDGYPYKHGKQFRCPGARQRVAAMRGTADPVLSRRPG